MDEPCLEVLPRKEISPSQSRGKSHLAIKNYEKRLLIEKRIIVAVNEKCNFVIMFYCGVKVGVSDVCRHRYTGNFLKQSN